MIKIPLPNGNEQILTDRQAYILDFYNREEPYHLILEGAVRSGKTHLNNLLFMAHIASFPKPGKQFILTGRTAGSIERNVLQPWEQVTGRDIKVNNYGEFSWGPHKVACFGADNEKAYMAMQGMTGYGWYANEVTTHHPNTVSEAFERCSGEGARFFWDTNPEHPFHYIKTEHIDHSGIRDDKGHLLLQSFHFTLEDNELLTPQYIEQVKRNTPEGMWYDRRIKGLWVAAEGIIYETFHREKHVYEPFPIPDDWRRVRGIDFGTVHPFVMLWGAIDPDGRLYIYREYFKTNTLIREHAEHIKKVSEGERYWWTVSDHDAQERLEYESHDIPTRPAQKAVLLGIDRVAQRMTDQIDGKPRVMISRDCPELLRQLGTYRWTDMQDGKPYREEPLKVDDDGPDVLRYMIMELDNNTTPIISTGFRGFSGGR